MKRFLFGFLAAALFAALACVTAVGAAEDRDRDGVDDAVDNCPTVYNTPATPGEAQADVDGDGKGDHCDDSDFDGLNDHREETATFADPVDGTLRKSAWHDAYTDTDGWSDGYEVRFRGTNPTVDDSDADGHRDHRDNCPTKRNDQQDLDRNGVGDSCQFGELEEVADDLPTPPPSPNLALYSDLNRMASDGYVLRIVRSSARNYTVQVRSAATGKVVELALPTGVTETNGLVTAFALAPSGELLEQVSTSWTYLPTSKAVKVKVDPAGRAAAPGIVFSVPPLAAPAAGCVGVALPASQPECDGLASGFYNPLKATSNSDPLDAVATPVNFVR